MSTDDITRQAVGEVQLCTRILKSKEGEGVNLLLIEGDSATLRYLGELLLAAAEEEDCGFSISPSGPGQVFFAAGAEMGLYIHRTPCARVESTETTQTE